jgi:26S proteasome regulatory subunit N5
MIVHQVNFRSRPEKTYFILEQIRLCIAASDWLTAENMSRKISTRWFDSKDDEDAPAEADESIPSKAELKLKLNLSMLD